MAEQGPAGGRGAGGVVAAAGGGGAAEERGAAVEGQPVRGGVQGGEVVQHAPEYHRSPQGEFGAGVDEGEDPVVLVEDVEVLLAGGREDVAAPPLPVGDADGVEDRDRPGRHQHRVGPGGVLVVAGREGEPFGLDERAAVRLVPDDHEEAQQFGALGEPEAGGSVLVEVGAEDVADAAAGPVRTGVVVHQDVGLAGRVDAVGDGLERVRQQGVVAVEEDEVVAGGPGHPGVAGRAQPGVARQVESGEAVVPAGVLVGDRPAGVGGAVVDHDDLVVLEGLGQYRVQTRVQIRLDPERGHDDGEPGHYTSRGRSFAEARQSANVGWNDRVTPGVPIGGRGRRSGPVPGNRAASC